MRNRLAVIMVADIVGYTGIMADDEQAGIAVVHEVNNKYLEPGTERTGGEILKRLGDGWIVAFGSVQAGIKCATELLEALNGHPVIKVRIGAHIGEIVEDDADFYGAGVNLAARLQSEAPPAGLMVSGDLYRQLTGEIAQQFESAGSFELKNIPYPVEGYQWRPKMRKAAADAGEIPSVMVEKFEYAPHNDETEAHAQELRDQVLMILSQRTGIKTIDALDNVEATPVYRLRGRFRMSGSKARMNVSMILCETAETLFSRNYDGDVSDIFEFADKITAQVSADTRIQINANDANRVKDLPDDELSASELRSRAANEFYRCTYDSWAHAVELMDRALDLNPNDPMALGMRGLGISLLSAARFETMGEADAQALCDDLDRAISAVQRSDFLFAARANVNAFATCDAQAAIRDGKRSLEINPHYLVGYVSQAQGHMLAGEFAAAIEVLDQSMEIGTEDPLEPSRLFLLAVSLYCAEDFERCVEITERIILKTSENWALHKLRSMALLGIGDKAGAERCEAQAARLPRTASIVTCKPPLPTGYEAFLAELKPDIRA